MHSLISILTDTTATPIISLIRMNLMSNVLMFLLLMETMAQNGGLPPSIPHLNIYEMDSMEPHKVLTNETMQYSDSEGYIVQIDCDTAHFNLESNFSWRLDGEELTNFNFNESIIFEEPNFGLVFGTYECFVSNSYGTAYSAVSIVQDAVKPPSFSFVSAPQHLTVSKHSTVKFNCESSDSQTSIQWTFNSKPIDNVNMKILKDEDHVKQSLVIEQVDEDTSGNIGCFIVSDSDKIYQEARLVLVDAPGEEVMTAPDVVITDHAAVITVLTDDQVILECSSEGMPDPSVNWNYDGEMLSGNVITIDSAGLDDAGVYTCESRNLAGSDYKSTVIRVFNRTILEQTEDTFQQKQIGEQLTLTCKYSIDSNLESSFSVLWTLNGKEIIDEDMIVTSETEAVLTVTDLKEDQFGNYSCVVNTDLQEESLFWNIEKVSPATILNEMTDRLVLEGTVLKLDCDVTGDPIPSVHWFYKHVPVQQHFDDVLVTGNSLEFSEIKLDHSGMFTCKAENIISSDEKMFNVSVAKPTKPPEGFESSNLIKMAGESVQLNCTGQVDHLLVQSTEFTWYKDDHEVAVDLVAEGGALNIQYLHSDHAGVFTCQIRTVLDIVKLETSLTVVTAEPVIQTQDLQTIREMTGGNVSITCESTGVPAPTNTFRFGEKDYSGTVVSTTLNKTITTLQLYSVTLADEGDYACLAVNEYGSSESWTTVDVYERTQMLSGPRDVVQKSGGSITLPCQVVTDPILKDSLTISWLKNQQPVDSSSGSIVTSSLMLNNLTKEDEGMYTCIGSTSKDNVTVSGRVTVLFEPPAFSSTPRDIRVLEGRSTQLVCTATGIPEPQIYWSLDGSSLASENGILRLSKLSLDKEGEYECKAVNMYGSVSQSVKLQVIKEARKENENLIPDIVKNIKDDITLPCDFKLDQRIEQETSVIWYKDNQEISYSSSKYSLEANRSLKIQNIELADGGQYSCTIITPLQRLQSKISLIVSGETPEIVSNFGQTTFHEGEPMSLTCRARGVPTPSIEWMTRDQPVNPEYVMKIPASASREFVESRIVIGSASKEHDGVYQCVAKNNVGTVVKSAAVGVLRRTRVNIQGDEKLPEISVQAGQKLKLPCKVDNDPANRITGMIWEKNGTKIAYGGDDIIDFGMDGSITIFSVQRRHEGIYTCKVKTVYDEESADIKVRVEVNAPVITKSSRDVHIFSGESTMIECTASGIPEPEIRWTFNRTITKVVGNKFEIKSAISADGGFYTCTARNSIGETEKTIRVNVVTMPHSLQMYQAKKGKVVTLPCVRQSDNTNVLWLKDAIPMGIEDEVEIDEAGHMVLRNLSESQEGEYTCRVEVGDTRIERKMEVKLMPDIVTMENTRLTVKEGENFTLKCDVLPDVNAKRMWKKEGQLVFPESGSGLDILEQGGVLTVSEARLEHSGEWKCIASTDYGTDAIIYWLKVLTRARMTKPACTERSVPVIDTITSTSNTSVRLQWSVNNMNSSCFQQYLIFWWSKQKDSNFDNKTVELTNNEADILSLEAGTAYYFQVNLVRDKQLKDYVYGQTKSHVMQYSELADQLTQDSFAQAVIIIVVVVVVVAVLLIVAYLKRDTLARYLSESTKSKHELPEMSSKLVMNPDFMASLAPQWPEPEQAQWPEPERIQWPEPATHETHAFLPQQQHSKRPISRRNSKDSLSSWSSLFNVATNENVEDVNQHRKQQATRPLDRRKQHY